MYFNYIISIVFLLFMINFDFINSLCKTTMTTPATKLTCKSNEYWNGVNCVSKLYKYFYTRNFTVRKIFQHNGTKFNDLKAVRIQHSPKYSIYASYGGRCIVRFDEFGNSLESNTFMGSNFITIVENGNIYGIDSYRIYEFSQNLTLLKLRSNLFVNTGRGIKYDSHSGLLYVSDHSYNSINAYDLNLKMIPSATIDLRKIYPGYARPYSIDFYRTPTTTYIYIALNSLNKIIVVDMSTKNKTSELHSGCVDYGPFDLLIDQNSNYLLVACGFDDYIALWETNGVTHTNTNKILINPSCKSLDYDQHGRLYVASDNIITIYE